MSDFSRPPADALRDAQNKGYTGIHIEQGVPILDRDLNLMHDLLASGIRSMLSHYIGNGIPDAGDGFAIRALPDGQNANNFQIMGPGACLVAGTEVTIDATVDYGHQPHVAELPNDHPSQPQALTTPAAPDPDPRTDIVFLDIFTAEVAGTPDLDNRDDVGMQTSVRIKAVWTVRVAENADSPPPAKDGHVHYPLARLQRRRGEPRVIEGPVTEGQPAPIADLRQRRLTVATLESRLTVLERELFAPSFTQDPSVGQIKPRFGRVGFTVTLGGKNFNKGTIAVQFGTVAAQIVGTPTDSEIKAIIPGGITREGASKDVKITVSNQIGSAVSDRAFQVLAAPVFALPPNPQFTPTSGAPGTPVTLSGFNFTPGNPAVTFGGTNATVLPNATYSELRVEVPSGIPPNTDVKIKVSFPDPARGSSESTSTFKVLGN